MNWRTEIVSGQTLLRAAKDVVKSHNFPYSERTHDTRRMIILILIEIENYIYPGINTINQ